MSPKIVLFGATGYTGHLVAEALVDRGLRPILCGRSAEKLERQAQKLGGLKTAIADVSDEAGLAALLSKGDILISTVGPFVKYGRTAVSAAVQKGAIYIDSTGEPAFIQEVFDTYGPQAQATGATLIPACGYDYIPGNCAGGVALSQAGSRAERLDVGYFAKVNGRIASLETSQGTGESLRLAMVAPIKVWQGGRFQTVTGGTRVRSFRLEGLRAEDKADPALSISCTEHFSLPRIYPHLKDINTYLGWFAGRTYLMKYAAIMQSLLVKLPGYRALAQFILSLPPASKGQGPDAEGRKTNTSHIVAEAFDASGQMLARADMVGVDGYTFTARFIAWAADFAHQGLVRKAGAMGPIEAFGLDALREGCVQGGLEIS
ncbi:MAG: saccharopine dehydrogenase NADP-binding domain-containing protein [Desulfobacterales bacterium]|nr:saccharopine dehydrogenase NADP-binding domain-containing protein [Desulfobacterales bacterium]